MTNQEAAGANIAGRYEIQSYLDEGGMQKVYVAKDNHIDRIVALKTPKNPSAEKRFQRSAFVSSKIHHSSVARTLDYFRFNGKEYLIEEYIEGDNLQKLFVQNFKYMDPFLVAHIGNHLVRGLRASHRADVVHRDLKPSNILVKGGLKFQEIKITDFGIAKLADDELKLIKQDDNVQSTIAGSQTLVGAIPFMAPELLVDKKDAELSSDIWSIGAIIYYLLSGNHPYSSNFVDVIMAYTQKKALPEIEYLESCDQSKILARSLMDVIRSCMNYDYRQRPTADDLVGVFDSLCYPVSQVYKGEVENIPAKSMGKYGFIRLSNGNQKVFFHMDEVYGEKPQHRDRVAVSAYPGEPEPRAFPVVKTR